ncbi:MAG: CPBP family intramembrane glutamic endopeptidase [Rhodothermales bacterium]|nr:CPBP family intramembrane glutamic endopeptidase [Rhodothermales bacterium]
MASPTVNLTLSADQQPPSTYMGLTRTATYGFLSALPLILLYEALIIVANGGRAGEIRVSSEVWLKEILASMGAQSMHVLAGIVIVIGFGIVIYERKKDIPIRLSYFIGMMIESMLYAVLVAMLVSEIVWRLFDPTAIQTGIIAQVEMGDLWTQIALSIGAGIYEELVFRVIVVGGVYLFLHALFGFKTLAYLIAAVSGAFLFSLVHYIGPLGDTFTLASFAFRFLFGLALNVLYLTRGFGVAAWTHALYDIMIVTHLLG